MAIQLLTRLLSKLPRVPGQFLHPLAYILDWEDHLTKCASKSNQIRGPRSLAACLVDPKLNLLNRFRSVSLDAARFHA